MPGPSKQFIPKIKEKVSKVMQDFREGKLYIGKSDKKVVSREQAKEIALSTARKTLTTKKKKKNG